MAAQDTDLISSYVDRTGIESDTAFILEQLRSVQTAINQTNKNKVTLDQAKTFRQATESANALKQSTVQLVDAQGRLISTGNAIAGATKKTQDAYTQLNNEYKAAVRNAANMALEYGAQSEQALNAAAAAAKLKEKLDEANKAAKGGGRTVEFTSNFDELEKERAAAEKTGTVVSELDKQQADAVQSANEWASAQGDAGDAAQQSAEQLKQLADAFAGTETPFANLTGTLEANIKQSNAYKNQLKEITAELKELNQNPEGNSSRIAVLTKEQADLKIASSELSQTINAQVKYLQAAEGSVDQLSQKLGLMKNAFRQMTDQEKQSSFGKQFLSDIQTLDAEVKRQDALIGNFQRNVGNYANSLSPFFDKLAEQITKLKQEQQGLQDLSQRNPVGFQIGGGADRLNQVTGFIQKLEQVQSIGFKTGGGNTAQQINTIDKALQDAAKDGGQTSEVLQELVQDLNKLKSASSVTGTTFSGAMKVLENELAAVREKLKDPALTGAQLKKLEQEEQLLAQLTQNLGKVFNSTREQLRAFTEASIQLGTQMGATSDVVVEFQTEVGSAINEVNDLKETIKLQAGDTKFLTGAVAAVNGLAGAYGAAQGAVQLFGNDSEELQRTMVKLQALLTIINGLQAVENALQTESGAIQTILAARMGLVNAAKAVQAKLFGVTAAAATAEAAAMTEAATATEATAAAQTEAAASAAATAGAMEGEAAAAVTATAATKTFGTTLAATGIGALILAAAAAVVYLVSKVNDWVQSNGKALEQQNKLNEAIKEGNTLLVEQASLFVRSQEGFKGYLQKQLEFTQAAGLSQTKQFAIRKQIAKEEKVLADTQVQQLGVTQKQQSALLSQIESLQGRRQQFISQLQQAIAKKDDSGVEAIQKNIDATDKALQALTPLYEGVVAARQRQSDANKALGQIDIEQAKFEADERRRLILESTQIETDLIKAKNSQVLSSDRSSLNQRLQALKANAAAEKAVIQAQRNDVLNNPGSSDVDKRLANERAAAETKKVDRQLAIDRFNTFESFRLRDLQAEKAAAQARIQLEIDTNKEIAQSAVFSLQQRLQAQATYNRDQKKLLDDNLNLQLANAGFSDKEIQEFIATGKYQIENKKVTTAELLDIQTQYETAVLTLQRQTSDAINEIVRSDLSKQQQIFEEHLQDIQDKYNSIDLSFNIDYSEEVIALNESLKKREITQEQYAKRRLAIDRKYQRESTLNMIASLEEQLTQFEDTEKEEVAARVRVEGLKQLALHATTDAAKKEILEQLQIAEDQLKIEEKNNEERKRMLKELAALKKKYSEDDKQNTEDDDKRRNDNAAAWLERVNALNQQLTSLGNSIFDRRIAKINDEQNAVEERYKREIDIINQTTVNGVDKEKKIAEAEARHNAQRFQLDQREKQENLKKARFDKQQAILSIIVNTAAAVVKAGVITPAAIAAGIIGAAELAAAVAAPLPQYFRGKTKQDTYEGPATWGEQRSELRVKKDGTMEISPNRPTLTKVERDDVIYPDARKALVQKFEAAPFVSKLAPESVTAIKQTAIQSQLQESKRVALDESLPLERRNAALNKIPVLQKQLTELSQRKETVNTSELLARKTIIEAELERQKQVSVFDKTTALTQIKVLSANLAAINLELQPKAPEVQKHTTETLVTLKQMERLTALAGNEKESTVTRLQALKEVERLQKTLTERQATSASYNTIQYLKQSGTPLPSAKQALGILPDETYNMDNRVSSITRNTTMRTYNTARHYEATKSEDVHFKKFNDTLGKGLKELGETIKNKKENHFHFMDRGKLWVHSGKNWQEFLNK